MSHILITGGAGFIGCNFVQYMVEHHPTNTYIVLDKLTYAGNLKNLETIKEKIIFIKGDVADEVLVNKIFKEHKIEQVIHFAAETHVDRSIAKAEDFIRTDIFGTFILLEAAKKSKNIKLFIQISTDEVYGSISAGHATETYPLMPSNPYSASKAGADRLAYSYFVTYQLPVIITRCSNNFGPYQYPEKIIPLFITNALENKNLPLYGDGQNVRDWIFVKDHVLALEFLMSKGTMGEVYNIGGANERKNIEITEIILKDLNKNKDLISYVKDRLGHDRRYALDSNKLKKLGWMPKHSFDQAIKETIAWYKDHESWWKPIKSGEYLKYYQKMYSKL